MPTQPRTRTNQPDRTALCQYNYPPRVRTNQQQEQLQQAIKYMIVHLRTMVMHSQCFKADLLTAQLLIDKRLKPQDDKRYDSNNSQLQKLTSTLPTLLAKKHKQHTYHVLYDPQIITHCIRAVNAIKVYSKITPRDNIDQAWMILAQLSCPKLKIITNENQKPRSGATIQTIHLGKKKTIHLGKDGNVDQSIDVKAFNTRLGQLLTKLGEHVTTLLKAIQECECKTTQALKCIEPSQYNPTGLSEKMKALLLDIHKNHITANKFCKKETAAMFIAQVLADSAQSQPDKKSHVKKQTC